MGKFILTDVVVYTGAADLSGSANQIELTESREEKDKTTFGSSGSRELLGGLSSIESSLEGYFEAGSEVQPDDRLFGDLGVSGVPLSVAPDTADDGDLAYFASVLRPEYSLLGTIGDVAPFSSRAIGDGSPLVRGTILHPGATARTTTGTGTARQLTAVSASQRLYAALHVLEASGTSPTLDVDIESDDGAGFATGTTQISFDQATDVGGQFKSAVGPITDDYFRVSYTIGGTSPSFKFAVVVGIATP